MRMIAFDCPLSAEGTELLRSALAEMRGRVVLVAEPRATITVARIASWLEVRTRYPVETMRDPSKRTHPTLRQARAALAWGMRVLLETEIEAIGQWFGRGFGWGQGLLVFAERERGRNPVFLTMTEAMVAELLA